VKVKMEKYRMYGNEWLQDIFPNKSFDFVYVIEIYPESKDEHDGWWSLLSKVKSDDVCISTEVYDIETLTQCWRVYVGDPIHSHSDDTIKLSRVYTCYRPETKKIEVPEAFFNDIANRLEQVRDNVGKAVFSLATGRSERAWKKFDSVIRDIDEIIQKIKMRKVGGDGNEWCC